MKSSLDRFTARIAANRPIITGSGTTKCPPMSDKSLHSIARSISINGRIIGKLWTVRAQLPSLGRSAVPAGYEPHSGVDDTHGGFVLTCGTLGDRIRKPRQSHCHRWRKRCGLAATGRYREFTWLVAACDRRCPRGVSFARLRMDAMAPLLDARGIVSVHPMHLKLLVGSTIRSHLR